MREESPDTIGYIAPPEIPKFPVEAFERGPCPLCGYNGHGYYQPTIHKCAIGYHAAIDAGFSAGMGAK